MRLATAPARLIDEQLLERPPHAVEQRLPLDIVAQVFDEGSPNGLERQRVARLAQVGRASAKLGSR